MSTVFPKSYLNESDSAQVWHTSAQPKLGNAPLIIGKKLTTSCFVLVFFFFTILKSINNLLKPWERSLSGQKYIYALYIYTLLHSFQSHPVARIRAFAGLILAPGPHV